MHIERGERGEDYLSCEKMVVPACPHFFRYKLIQKYDILLFLHFIAQQKQAYDGKSEISEIIN